MYEKARSTIERLYVEALTGESYENAAEALDKMEELKKFRKDVSGFQFSSFNIGSLMKNTKSFSRIVLVASMARSFK